MPKQRGFNRSWAGSELVPGSGPLWVGTSYQVGGNGGELLQVHELPAPILDIVFDANDDLYGETHEGIIYRMPADGSTPVEFVAINSGHPGKLAISPDRYLVRMQVLWATGLVSEWPLF